MTLTNLAVRQLEASDGDGLADLFSAFARANYESMFHPHPFDRDTAYRIAGYMGLDYYCCAWNAGTAVAYGMLRGFDAGFAVPSLGIATHPDHRGIGLAKAVIANLHQTALSRGASSIRLKVYPNNGAAKSLYDRFGYIFSGEVDQGQLIATCVLSGVCEDAPICAR